MVQAAWFGSAKRLAPALALPIKIVSSTIGLCAPLGYKTAESPTALERLGFAATFPQDLSTVPGPGA